MWQLGAALAALCIGAAVLRDRCVFGVCAVLLANWVINTSFVRVTSDLNPWGFFLGVDYISGVFAVAGIGLICGRFTFGSVVIGLSYAAECVIHAAYGLSDQGAWAQYRYWWATFYVAVGQMLFMLGWGAYELARRSVGSGRGLSPDAAVPQAGGVSTPQEP